MAPLLALLIVAYTIYSLIDFRRTVGDWDGAMDIFGAIYEGLSIGFKFNWHWAKTGEIDFDYLNF
jgi:hypothetical protein